LILLDENLSPRLVERLASLFPGLAHVRDIGLKRASDQQIWQSAKKNGYTIVTADADFLALSRQFGWPPKVIHLERCDFPLRVVEELLRHNAIRIVEFDQDRAAGVLILRLAPR
jgi:predicted nuclease of predicted toxin-antitoxin system